MKPGFTGRLIIPYNNILLTYNTTFHDSMRGQLNIAAVRALSHVMSK